MRDLYLVLAVVLTITISTAALMRIDAEADDNDTWIDEEYVKICEEVGEEYHISPELLIAIIETESSGKPYANNGKCKGLCQIYESCHKDRMARLGISDIYDPRGNITLAADILVECFETYGDDLMLVLMKYNGVSHAEEKALSGQFSTYAEKVSQRAWELEEIHGKHDYSQYVSDSKQLSIRYKED